MAYLPRSIVEKMLAHQMAAAHKMAMTVASARVDLEQRGRWFDPYAFAGRHHLHDAIVKGDGDARLQVGRLRSH